MEVAPDGALTDVEATLEVLGLVREGSPATLPERPSLDLSSQSWLLPGRTVGTITAEADGTEVGRARFAVRQADRPPVSGPSVVGLVLLLFCLASLESLAGPVRRGRRLRATALGGAVLLGAGAGTAAAVLGWALLDHLLLPRVLVVCAVLGAATAACGLRLLAARAGQAQR